jgi:hypothetical protein
MKSLLPSLNRLETGVNICKLLRVDAWAMQMFWIHLKDKAAAAAAAAVAVVVVAAAQCSEGVHAVQTLGLSVSYIWHVYTE